MVQRFIQQALCGLLLLGPLLLFGQSPITYSVDLAQIVHHELRISVEFPALPRQVLQVRMPRSSPGRYALHEFAKNVYEVAAYDEANNPLPVTRASPHQWNVSGHHGFVRFEYTLFGNRADGTYTGIDRRKVHLNMPATFVYGADLEGRPVELTIDLSDHADWTVATQLIPLGSNRFRAPDYYYFYDSPTIIGDLERRSWNVSDEAGTYTIEVAMDHEGTDRELDDYAAWIRDIVEVEKEIFGEFPRFDYSRYTFLCTYNPWVSGDGMEHRNSTICSASVGLDVAAKVLIGTVAHEFFHAWNVERLRPQSLEPFDFDEANMSGELWFAEGFTSYYTNLVLRRAGILSTEEFLQRIQNNVVSVLGAPGHNYRSPVEMSYQAPFVDAASSIDPTNFGNTVISYYTYGAFIGLALDLSIRTQFEGRSLDDLMARLWDRYGRPEVPYANHDIQQALAEVTGDEAFAKTFFAKYIYDGQMPDMKRLFAALGITLRPAQPGQAGFLGPPLTFTEQGATIAGALPVNNPLYQTGLADGDRIVAMDGTAIDSRETFQAVTDRLRPGKSYQVRFVRDDKELSRSFEAVQDAAMELVVDRPERGRTLRSDWLRTE